MTVEVYVVFRVFNLCTSESDNAFQRETEALYRSLQTQLQPLPRPTATY